MAKPSPDVKPAVPAVPVVPPEPFLLVAIRRTAAGKYAVWTGKSPTLPAGMEVSEADQSLAVAWGAVVKGTLRLRKFLTDGRW